MHSKSVAGHDSAPHGHVCHRLGDILPIPGHGTWGKLAKDGVLGLGGELGQERDDGRFLHGVEAVDA